MDYFTRVNLKSAQPLGVTTVGFQLVCLPLLFVLSACIGFGPVEPNKPYQGEYPAFFSRLTDANQLLAWEVAKLPETQDGISPEEVYAIHELIDFYFAHKSDFDRTFQIMYRVGIPEIRKYLTPLQALFWMAEDNLLDERADLLTDYSLDKLLQAAWNFSMKPEIRSLDITESKAAEILTTIDSKVIWYAKNQKSAVDTLIICYTRTPDAIPRNHRQFLESLPEIKRANQKFLKNQARWSDPTVVVDRLNSPELLDYYIDKNIHYKLGRPSYTDSIYHTIHTKSGGCDDLAMLGKVALSRAGYKVFGRIIGSGSPSDWHVGLVAELEDGTYLMAVNFKRSNVMTGPHRTLREADQALGLSPSKNLRGPFNFDWRSALDSARPD
jgi:hypothetical protein